MEDEVSSCSLPYSYSHSAPANNAGGGDHAASASLHVTCGASSCGSIAGAKYQLISPAKLQIDRSISFTPPPSGSSPTSFLEYLTRLSNSKAAPSFLNHPFMQNSGNTAAPCIEKHCCSSINDDDKASTSCSFEFKLFTGSYSSGPTCSVPVGLNQNGPVNKLDEYFSSVPPSTLAVAEKHKQPATVDMHYLPVSTTVNELTLDGRSDSGIFKSPFDQKDGISLTTGGGHTGEGYNWRKYGQKVVKGSVLPRSYYKCTYPNCEVKRIFDRTPSGQITEIVYKGSHDHPKPQASRRYNSAALTTQDDTMEQDDKMNTNCMEQNLSQVVSPQHANEGFAIPDSQIYGTDNKIDDNDQFSKLRKIEDELNFTPVIKPIREPRVIVQTTTEIDILDDGYRWRKYGQKVVRGNPNPRSYYKCTVAGCTVRKHVERASHDPKSVLTTYEGKHNHDLPIGRNTNHEFAISTNKNTNAEGSSSGSRQITLDLGVGIPHFVSQRRS